MTIWCLFFDRKALCEWTCLSALRLTASSLNPAVWIQLFMSVNIIIWQQLSSRSLTHSCICLHTKQLNSTRFSDSWWPIPLSDVAPEHYNVALRKTVVLFGFKVVILLRFLRINDPRAPTTKLRSDLMIKTPLNVQMSHLIKRQLSTLELNLPESIELPFHLIFMISLLKKQ